MSKPSSSVRTLLPLFTAALFVGGISAFAYYQNNDNDGSDDASFSLPNPPVLAKYSGNLFGQTLVGALPPELHFDIQVPARFTPVLHAEATPWVLSFATKVRGPPAYLS